MIKLFSTTPSPYHRPSRWPNVDLILALLWRVRYYLGHSHSHNFFNQIVTAMLLLQSPALSLTVWIYFPVKSVVT